MICYFCNKYIYNSVDLNDLLHIPYKGETYIHQCIGCNVDYYDKGHANLYLPFIHERDILNLSYFQFNLIPHKPRSRIISKGHIVFEAKYMLNITPQNINEKIKLYCTFL